jgi:quercetin dioxygenase-like cupin family protein
MAKSKRKESKSRSVGHEAIDGTLTGSVLKFNLANEVDLLHRDESWLQSTGRSSKTLAKYSDLRIVLIAMKANTRMHEHTAAGRISVQSLYGHILLHLPERVADLPAGNVLVLDQSVPHDVEALKDSAFLLTLSWPPETIVAETKMAVKKTARHKKR